MTHCPAPFRHALCALLSLAAASTAQRELLDELPGATDAYISSWFGPEFEELELPGAGVVVGVARAGERLWLARGDELLRLSWPGLAVEARVDRPEGLRDLGGDGRFVYALTEREVLVLDPLAGVPVRTLPVEFPDERRWPHALCLHDGALFVLSERSLYPVDLTTGAIGAARPLPGRRRSGFEQLASGPGGPLRLSDGGIGALVRFDGVASPDDERWRRQWPVGIGDVRATLLGPDRLLVCGRHDGRRSAFAGVLRPVREEPRELISVKLHYLGPKKEPPVRWEVGPKAIGDVAGLRRELQRIAAHRAKRGEPPLPVVLEPYPGTDIAMLRDTWDAVVAAGVAEVSSPAQEAWARRVVARRRAK